jgi:hypothetical protein
MKTGTQMKIKNSSIAFLLLSSILLSCNSVSSLVPEASSPEQQGIPEIPSADCAKYALTPEECANAGTHKYSTATQVLFDQSGNTCLTNDDDVAVSITFMSRDTFLYVNSFGVETEFTRKDHNYYEGGYVQPEGQFEWKNTITFTSEGFTKQGDSFDLERNEHLCTFLWEQKIITENTGKSTLSERESADLARVAIEQIVGKQQVQVFWHTPQRGHLIFGISYATDLKPESQPDAFTDQFNRVTLLAATYFHQTSTKAQNIIVMAEDVDFPTSDKYPPLRQVIIEKETVSAWAVGEKTDAEFIESWFVVPIEVFPTHE